MDFEQIYRDYFRKVARFFMGKGRSAEQAEDLTQEVFRRVYTGMRRFRHDSRVSTWIFTIARNVWLNEIRAEGTGKRQGSEVPIDDSAEGIRSQQTGPEGELLRDERVQALRRALDELPDRMRTSVQLRIDQDLKYAEIAKIMGVSVQTIKSQLFQARQRLKELLGEHYGPGDTEILEATDDKARRERP